MMMSMWTTARATGPGKSSTEPVSRQKASRCLAALCVTCIQQALCTRKHRDAKFCPMHGVLRTSIFLAGNNIAESAANVS